jgi:hypothetical protein
MLICTGKPSNKGASVCYTSDVIYIKPEVEAEWPFCDAVTAACNKALSTLVA